MALINVNRIPSPKELRLFAGVWWPAMCLVLGAMIVRKQGQWSPALWLWGLGAALAASGLLRPALIKPFYLLLQYGLYPIGWALSYVILGILYYLIITPVGVLVRRFKDPMDRKFDHSVATYWLPRDEPLKERYLRQI
jgi:hypothetical protein